jgi:hypothetical protein
MLWLIVLMLIILIPVLVGVVVVRDMQRTDTACRRADSGTTAQAVASVRSDVEKADAATRH